MSAAEVRRRRRRAARGFVALAVALAAVVACALLAPALVPGDRLAPRVAEALAAATGGKATVGAAHLTLVGGPGLRLRDVQLEAGPAGGATCAEASVSLAVLPLLRRTLVVDALAARGTSARAAWQGRPLALTDFTLRADRLRLTLPPLGTGAAAGRAAAPGTTSGGLAAWPADAAGTFTLTAATADWAPVALAGIACEGELRGRRLNVRRLVAGLGGGHVTVAGTLDLPAAAAGGAKAQVTLEAVSADALLAGWAPEVATRLDGVLSGTANVECPLGEAAAALTGLRADGLVTTGSGLLRAGDWLQEAGPYLGDRPDLVDIRFNGGALGFRLADGVCTVDSLRLSGPDTAWDVRGDVSLAGDLDLAIHLRLPAGFTPQLGSLSFFAEALRDKERRINLDLRVRGPGAEAAATLDLAAMAQRAGRAGT